MNLSSSEAISEFGNEKNNLDTESRVNQKPEIKISHPENNSEVSGVIQINGTARDDGLIKNVTLKIGLSNYLATDTSGNDTWYSWTYILSTFDYKNGLLTVEVYAYDNDTYSRTELGLIVANSEILNTPPRVWITSPKNNSDVEGFMEITGNADDDYGILYVNLTIAGDEYAATDVSGNGTWYHWKMLFDTTYLTDGIYIIYVEASDGALSNKDAVTVNINNQPAQTNIAPKIKIIQPKNASIISGTVLIKGTASDDVMVKSVTVEIGSYIFPAEDLSGNNSWFTWSYSLDTVKYVNGKLTIIARASDGFHTSSTEIGIILNNPDETMAPTIWIDRPLNNSEVSGMLGIVGGAYDDERIDYVKLTIGNQDFTPAYKISQPNMLNWSIVLDTKKLENGEHIIIAVASDGSNSGSCEVIIIVNNPPEVPGNIPPKIEITQPKYSAKVIGRISIEGLAWDLDGKISFVEIEINKFKYYANDISENNSWYIWKYEFDTTVLPNGWYRLSARANDSVTASSVSTMIYIINREPDNCPVLKLEPLPAKVVSGVVTFSGKAWDNNEVRYVKVKIGNIFYNATDISGNDSWFGWEYRWDTVWFPDGPIIVKFVVYDGFCTGFVEFRLEIDNDKQSVPIGTQELPAPDNKNTEDGTNKPAGDQPSGIIVMSITVIAISIFTFFGLALESGRYKILALFFVPLYVKRQKDKVLENFARGEIYGFIRSNPGTYFNHMKKVLKLNHGTLAYHLSVLENDELIYSKTDGMYRRFYPKNARFPRLENGGDSIHSFVQLNSTQDQIVNIIRTNPGTTQKEIARLMGKSTQVISYNVKVMSELGLLKLERKGKWTRCFIKGIHRIGATEEVVWED